MTDRCPCGRYKRPCKASRLDALRERLHADLRAYVQSEAANAKRAGHVRVSEEFRVMGNI